MYFIVVCTMCLSLASKNLMLFGLMNCCRLGFRYTVVGSWDFVNFVSTIGPSDRHFFLSLDYLYLHIMKYSFIEGGIPLGVFSPRGFIVVAGLKAVKNRN